MRTRHRWKDNIKIDITEDGRYSSVSEVSRFRAR
jgi:hypothetical protein